MKRRIIAICLISVLLMVVFGCSSLKVNEKITKSELSEYLSDRYGKEFVVGDKAVVDDEDVTYAYFATPKENSDILFVVGEKKSHNSFPFLPVYDQQVFYDDYYEKAKEFLLAELAVNYDFKVETEEDVLSVTNSIFELMKNLETELENMGFISEDNSCSITLQLTKTSKKSMVSFYSLDKTKIEKKVRQFYNE